ncbi:hypothetical protein ACJJTC_014804 [Scirpophaga incertulas]
MAKKLSYFNGNGFAEPIRYMLHYGGQKFEDVRYDHSKWPIASVKESLPFGQMPLYEEGDRSLHQSLAIARYIASQTGLLPSDPWKQAILDAAALTLYDFYTKSKPYDFLTENDQSKKDAHLKHLMEEHVPYFFSRFEKQLKANNGHFGTKLSWADFILVGIVEVANLLYNTSVEKGYPTIEALLEEIRTLPNVKEYIAAREPYSFARK